MNKVFLTGHVGKDPNIVTFENGGEIANFTLATNERGYTTKEGKVVPEETTWHNIVVIGALTKVIKEYVKKGTQLTVVGKIKQREYENQNGVKQRITEIVVNSFKDGEIELGGSGQGNRKEYTENLAKAYEPTNQYASTPSQPQPQAQPNYQQQQQYQQTTQQQYAGTPTPQPQPNYQQQYNGGGVESDNLPF
jgi:single-strand DNA-binding protein